jgi:hypothetical protein
MKNTNYEAPHTALFSFHKQYHRLIFDGLKAPSFLLPVAYITFPAKTDFFNRKQ